MNHKFAISIMILIAFCWASMGTEYIYLGSGIRDQIINLDAGSKLPDQDYLFGQSGFVTIDMPQTMALSPNMMINEAQSLLDEAALARNESASYRDETHALYEKAKELFTTLDQKERDIDAQLKKAELYAIDSSSNASQAKDLLNLTEAAGQDILEMSQEVDENRKQVKSLMEEIKGCENRTNLRYNEAEDLLNKSLKLYNNMTLLAAKISADSNTTI
ncbi:MAG: hypothetical protein QG666_1224 [Euryarchaeota archaeon]|nr:hypothetical protein [Euryarchaeota archaeon]